MQYSVKSVQIPFRKMRFKFIKLFVKIYKLEYDSITVDAVSMQEKSSKQNYYIYIDLFECDDDCKNGK